MKIYQLTVYSNSLDELPVVGKQLAAFNLDWKLLAEHPFYKVFLIKSNLHAHELQRVLNQLQNVSQFEPKEIDLKSAAIRLHSVADWLSTQ